MSFVTMRGWGNSTVQPTRARIPIENKTKFRRESKKHQKRPGPMRYIAPTPTENICFLYTEHDTTAGRARAFDQQRVPGKL